MGEGYFLHTGMLWVKQLRIGETREDTFFVLFGVLCPFWGKQGTGWESKTQRATNAHETASKGPRG